MKNSTTLISALFLCGAAVSCSDKASSIDAPKGPDAAKTIDAKPIDAPKAIDAAPPVAVSVSCTGAAISGTVTTPTFAFTPITTNIKVNQIVQFTMSNGHSVDSQGKGFNTGFDVSVCFKFTVVGSHGFRCNPHDFRGTIVVAP
jgi:plastocyanin